MIEVLRHTGIRIEELTELSHHSLIQYRLPATGELIPLLQIAPSKTDTERLLVISPELADVLSAIVSPRPRPRRTVPLVVAYDKNERVYNPPMPLLFQCRRQLEHQPVSETSLRKYLDHALAVIGVKDTAASPLRYTFHDFRRLFITDAIMHGMPPHIAQLVAGHRDINITMGYKAVYPEEVIDGHRAFIARRRALRPAAGIPGPDRRRMGTSSSATSSTERSPSATAAAPTTPPASTSTPASAARCCAPIPPSGPAWPRSAAT